MLTVGAVTSGVVVLKLTVWPEPGCSTWLPSATMISIVCWPPGTPEKT